MIAAGAWTAVYVLTMLVTGIVAASALSRERRPMSEIAALALTLGPGCTGMFLLLVSLLGVRPGRIQVLILALLGISVVLLLHRSDALCLPLKPRPVERNALLGLPLIFSILLIVAALAISVMTALAFETFSWDAFVIWGFKAKVLYYQALTPRPWYFHDLRLNYSHLDYPLLFPMIIAGAYGAMHQVNEPLGKVALPILFCGQALLVYSGTRQFVPRWAAAAVTALFIGSPMIVEQSGFGNADTVLASFRAGAVVYMARWIDERSRANALLAAAFSLLAAYTKNEGLALALLTGGIMTVFAWRAVSGRRGLWDVGWFWLIVLVGIGVWLAWRAGIPHTDENYPSRLRPGVLHDNASRAVVVLREFWLQLRLRPIWGWFWIVLPAVAVLGLPALRRQSTVALWLLLISHVVMYMLVYIISPWNVEELIHVSLHRLMMHVAPTAALLMAAHWGVLITDASQQTPTSGERFTAVPQTT